MDKLSDHAKSQQLLAYQTIRRDILDVRYAPGSRLQIKDLCRSLGVGRTPVRESLVRLCQENLVEMIPQSGTYVSRISLRAVESARFAREHLERQVAADCCGMITPRDVKALARLIHAQEAALGRHDAHSFFEIDNRLHGELYRIAGQELIWAWLDVISADLQRYRWLRLHTGELSWQDILDEHYDICDAIGERDVDRASYLTSRHMHLLFKENSAVTKAFPDYFVNDR